MNTDKKNQKWMSRAWWPSQCSSIGNYSQDFHYSKESAEAVCSLLHKNGFGGDRIFFPTRTEVIEVGEVNDTKPSASDQSAQGLEEMAREAVEGLPEEIQLGEWEIEELEKAFLTALRERDEARAACAVKDDALIKLALLNSGVVSGDITYRPTTQIEIAERARIPDCAAPLLAELKALREDKELLDWLEANHCQRAASVSVAASERQITLRDAIRATKGQTK